MAKEDTKEEIKEPKKFISAGSPIYRAKYAQYRRKKRNPEEEA